jgi:hypothetical protein
MMSVFAMAVCMRDFTYLCSSDHVLSLGKAGEAHPAGLSSLRWACRGMDVCALPCHAYSSTCKFAVCRTGYMPVAWPQTSTPCCLFLPFVLQTTYRIIDSKKERHDVCRDRPTPTSLSSALGIKVPLMCRGASRNKDSSRIDFQITTRDNINYWQLGFNLADSVFAGSHT